MPGWVDGLGVEVTAVVETIRQVHLAIGAFDDADPLTALRTMAQDHALSSVVRLRSAQALAQRRTDRSNCLPGLVVRSAWNVLLGIEQSALFVCATFLHHIDVQIDIQPVSRSRASEHNDCR